MAEQRGESVTYSEYRDLTPIDSIENGDEYIEALGWAFQNKKVKNIALTGPYGAGKSSIIETFLRQNDEDKSALNKIKPTALKISMATFLKGNVATDDNAKIEVDADEVEKGILKQLFYKVEPSKIPQSRYRKLHPIKKLKIFFYALLALLVVLYFMAVFAPFTCDRFIEVIESVVSPVFPAPIFIKIAAILLFIFFAWIITCLYWTAISKFRVKEIKLPADTTVQSGAEEADSVFNRNLDEIMYFFEETGYKTVFFEDLDRLDDPKIFVHLRELNNLLNNDDAIKAKPIVFVYAVRDDIFSKEDRTKFFDFILPIVPIVDSKTSENELIELFKAVENAPDRSVLADISLYVDDMRLLKNIVNEYIVYSKIIPLGQIDLESNKLFALITLKNIFPNEFDLLQEDKGFIRTIFDKLEANKKKVVNNLNQKLIKIDDDLEFIRDRVDNDKFKAMALMIQSDVGHYYQETRTWAEYLKEWSKKPDEQAYIMYSGGRSSFSYNEFINRFVLNNDEKRVLIEKLPEDFSLEVNKHNSDREKIKKQIRDIEIYSYKKLISIMSAEQKDELFLIDGFDIVESHYFPLIRVLILDGLLDETYWYYKGNFNVDRSNTLKRNDIIYVKGLKEGKELDIFLDVETPEQIINRLKLTDFSRDNILNKKVLKTCIEKNNIKCVIAITDSVDVNGKYEDLVRILDEFDLELVRTYSNILINDKSDRLVSILEYCEDESVETFKNILISVATNKTIALDNLVVFKEYIEQNENLISLIPEGQFDVFIDNIRSADIKFEDVSEANCDKARLVAVEQIKAYKLNVRNLIFISEAILEKTINYGSLLNEIFKSLQLSSSKEYIEDNFSSIVSNYVDENMSEKNYTNNEEILFKILNSDISDEDKFEYVEKNETVISKLADLQNGSVTTKILDCLFRKNKVKFCSDNIAAYWNMVEEYSDDFIEYLDNNLDENNYEDILRNNVSICNTFINSTRVSDKIFEFVIKCADEPISNINHKLTQNRVNILVTHRLIEVTEKNIEVLWNNSYNTELTLLANGDEEVEDIVINTLLKYDLSDNLIYSLVNSKLSDENSLNLINLIKDSVLVERINPDKRSIIKAVIKEDLSLENINYICKSFEMFELKDEFIESLDDEDKLEKLEDENLNEDFMNYVLNSSNIKIDTKVSLIKTKINNHSDINTLKQYISSVLEIADLSSVWNRRQPLLDNEYKERIGQALINSGYVRPRKDKYGKRIMLIKRLRNTTVDTRLL